MRPSSWVQEICVWTVAHGCNSIRHNLSLHSRFIRVQNEGTGKSSWWMINPDGGKGGKAPRRRAVSMDNSNKYTKSRGRAAKKKASMQVVQDTADDSPSQLKWPGSPTSRSSDELDAWTDFRSRTNSNASTISGRLSPIPATTELDDVQDDDSPISPMLYSPGSMSPSLSKPSTVELPRITDMAGTMNLNDGLTDNLMDDLLDDISLTSSQQSSPGVGMQRSSSFTYGTKGSSLSSPSSSFNNTSSFNFPLTSLRQSPMQTIQENKQATFSSINHYSNQSLQDLLTTDSLSHSDVLMTQSDPLMSQASTAVTAQNSRRNIILRNDPMMSFAAPSNQGGGLVNQNLLHHQQQSHSSFLGGSRAFSNSINNIGLNDSNNLDSSKHQQQSSVSHSMQALSDTLSGSLYTGMNLPVHEKFPTDLDLEIFNGSLECDMETIIRNELMDADGLDFNFDTLISAQNVSLTVGNFTGAKQTSSQSWVPG
ncbi:forkhead box protein O3 isoform X2 [Dendrobates tinctorius]|uniref:forkhead box protein O3 isoform X2 n=1 Tax=Dendrobates tinctorius TaxID=92724 RepID=UPI003CC94CDA